MKLSILLSAIFLGLILFLSSCDDEPIVEENPLNLPDTLMNYSDVNLPEHFYTRSIVGLFAIPPIDNDNTPENNPTTDAGATLGRILFYDKNLSQNRTISCASCHKQSLGFGDDKAKSIGFEGGKTERHSMSLANNRFYARKHYFSDERAETLEDLVLQPFQDPIEMGLTLEELIARINEKTYYPDLFEAAFGDTEVNTERIQKAVAQFVRSMISITSKYDIGRAEVGSPFEDFPNFTDEENLGKALFLRPSSVGVDAASCTVCHASETFSIPVPSNNGLDSVFNDLGTYNTFPFIHFTAAFKAPSLRNIAIRPPYMHDGRFSSLEEVIEHYNSKVIAHQSVPNNLKENDGSPRRMNYTDEQKTALVAFLNTLTDDGFLTDEKFSDPFVE